MISGIQKVCAARNSEVCRLVEVLYVFIFLQQCQQPCQQPVASVFELGSGPKKVSRKACTLMCKNFCVSSAESFIRAKKRISLRYHHPFVLH